MQDDTLPGHTRPEHTLGEELLLLALTAEGADDAAVAAALAGAQLMELDLLGRVDVVEDRLAVLDTRPTGRPDLDEVLLRVDDHRSTTTDEWIYSLTGTARAAVLEELLAAGAVVEERRRVLGLFPATGHAVADPGVAAAVAARIGRAVTDAAAPHRDVALLALVDAAGLVAAVLPAVDPAAVTARLAAAGGTDWAAGAGRVVEALRSAVRSVVGSAAFSTGVTTTTGLVLGNN